MIEAMEGFGGLFGDPEEMRRRMEELQEQMQGAQKVAWADNAIKLAVEMTVAAISSLELTRLERRAGRPGPRRDQDRLPGGCDPGPGGPRGSAGLMGRSAGGS